MFETTTNISERASSTFGDVAPKSKIGLSYCDKTAGSGGPRSSERMVEDLAAKTLAAAPRDMMLLTLS